MGESKWGWIPVAVATPLVWQLLQRERRDYAVVECIPAGLEEAPDLCVGTDARVLFVRRRPNKSLQVAYNEPHPADPTAMRQLTERVWRPIRLEPIISIRLLQPFAGSPEALVTSGKVSRFSYKDLCQMLKDWSEPPSPNPLPLWAGSPAENNLMRGIQLMDGERTDLLVMAERIPGKETYRGACYRLENYLYAMKDMLYDSDQDGVHQWILSIWEGSPRSSLSAFVKHRRHSAWREICTGGNVKTMRAALAFTNIKPDTQTKE